jgi:hypothetical protein
MSSENPSIKTVLRQEEEYLDELRKNPKAAMPDMVFYSPATEYEPQLIEVMNRIHEDGELDKVVLILESAEKTLADFKSDGVVWTIFQRYPRRFKITIEKLFNGNETTVFLTKHILFSHHLSDAETAYWVSFCILIATVVLSIFTRDLRVSVLLLLVLIVSVCVQINISNSALSKTDFTKAFSAIRAVYEKKHRSHLELIGRAAALSQFIEEQKIQLEEEKEESRRKASIIGVDEAMKLATELTLKKYKLETLEDLQSLMNGVALAEAGTMAAAQEIHNKVSLKHKNGLEKVETRRAATLSIIDSLGKALIKRMEILGEEGREDRKLRRQFDLINEIRNDVEQGNFSAEKMKNVYDDLGLDMPEF